MPSKNILFYTLLCFCLFFMGTESFAGTGVDGAIDSTEFDPVLNMILGLVSGSLAKTIAIMSFLFGVLITVIRNDLSRGAITCFVVSLLLSLGPTMIINTVSTGVF